LSIVTLTLAWRIRVWIVFKSAPFALSNVPNVWRLFRSRSSRHTFGTLLKANGEDVATVQALMRHANVSVTMNTYVQAVTPAKRKAQRGNKA